MPIVQWCSHSTEGEGAIHTWRAEVVASRIGGTPIGKWTGLSSTPINHTITRATRGRYKSTVQRTNELNCRLMLVKGDCWRKVGSGLSSRLWSRYLIDAMILRASV